jgi:AhpD family alkylhydroperoxidase
MAQHLNPTGDSQMTQRMDIRAVVSDGYAALLNVEKYLQKSGLDRRLVVLVQMRASQINGCAYCLHMHSEEARKLGESDTRLYLLDAWHESELFTPCERAALGWTEALTNIAQTHAPDAVYAEARRHFSEKELADLSIVIAMINAWNRLSIGSRALHASDTRKAAA